MLIDKSDSLNQLKKINELVIKCKKCNLSSSRKYAVPGVGPSYATLMFVGEAPGSKEDEVGLPFIGRAGNLLEKLFIEVCETLGEKHDEHMDWYGKYNEERLTGLHETCSINDFRYGVSDRGASIRIPMATANDGYGYLEDRRPSANMDPYEVCFALMDTICEKKMAEV